MTRLAILLALALAGCGEWTEGWAVNQAVTECGGADKVQQMIPQLGSASVWVICIDGRELMLKRTKYK